MDKKVSIIIPCYNQGKYVSDAINSALKQTYKNTEIVCINDGSTDNSSKIIKTFADKYKNILFIDEPLNKGIISARNTAILSSNGEYILPLDADDTIEPSYVEKAVKILDTKPDIGIVYCKVKLFGRINKNADLKSFDKSSFLYQNCIHNTAMYRKKDFIEVGMYKDNMKYGAEDYDLWLSLVEQGFSVYQMDEFLFNYRQYKEVSRTKTSKQNIDKVWKSLITNHKKLYFNDEQFIDKVLPSFVYPDYKKIMKKYKKYKMLFNSFLPIIIAETIFLIVISGLIIRRIYG